MHPYFRQGVFNCVLSKAMDGLQCHVISLHTDGTPLDTFKAGSLIMYKKIKVALKTYENALKNTESINTYIKRS